MARSAGQAKAFALILLMLLSSQLSLYSTLSDSYELEDNNEVKLSSSESTRVNIAGPGNIGVGPTLEMASTDALQTISMKIRAGTTYRATGFDWDDWSQSGFTTTGLEEDNVGALVLGFQGVVWDFNSGTQGWTTTSSSYAQRTTSITCGMSGGSGGSWWTRGSSVYVTSPTVNLAGYSGLSLNAWIRQGNSGCGEEPDSNENFYMQYRNSNNQWIQFQYLAGSTSGGSVTNVNYNLPSNAFHQNFQVRAYQNSGSGTCCDYWFFDDVIIPGTSGANLTTRSFGWTSSDDMISKGAYPPIFLDAVIPDGAFLNWTVIDANTGQAVPGFENRTGTELGLSSIDFETHTSLRLKLQFMSNQNGESPRLYSIHGGGKISETFNENFREDNWHLDNVTFNPVSSMYDGSTNSELISPAYDIDMPFSAVKIQTTSTGSPRHLMSVDYGAWMPFNPSNQIIQLEDMASNIRIKYESNGAIWSVEEMDLQLYPSDTIDTPYLDVDDDSKLEWSISQSGIGSWGNQDVFADDNKSISFQVGLTPTSWHDLFIPQDAKAFEVTVSDVGTVGLGVQNLALWIGNTMIAQVGVNDYVPELRLSLNESQLLDLNYETSNSAAAKLSGGVEFVHARIEVISDAGFKKLSGLFIPYLAEETIVATALDDLVMSINRERLNPFKASSMTLDFRADSKCSLDVEIISMTSSGDVVIGAMTWNNYTSQLIPSSDWREVNTRVQIHTSSAHRVILSLYSDDYSAMWLIPIQSGSIVPIGDHETLVIPTSAIVHNQSSSIHDMLLRFRTSQSFNDQEELRIETRIELTNGVISKPAVKTWSNGAVHNDLIIEDMVITNDIGVIPNSQKYLKAQHDISFHIDAGFKTNFENSKPFPGEYNLSLLRNGESIANTSEYTGDYWIVNTTTPFTSGNVTYEAIITPLAGGDLGETPLMNRTFEIDPLAPVVTDSNIRFYDHLTPSANRKIMVNITDQPVLPTNVTLMLWTEWSNDYDNNGWPSENEYIPRLMSIPSDLDAPVGSYMTVIDDTPAFPGEKVAGYIIGTDQSGYNLLGGGSSNIDDHLFMYQIRNDGSPVVDEDGLEWDGGRRTWLHPGQDYKLNVSFSEINGISDVMEIRVSLASNIPSDNMEVIWDMYSKECYSSSIHIVVNSCLITNSQGVAAGPFDQDLVLKLDLTPQWTVPDLGDTRREPKVEIIDRAGNSDSALFPQNRWRFSAEMMIPNDLDLWVENGAITHDGARVNPNTAMELSGSVYFAKTMDMPTFDCQIAVKINGVRTFTTSQAGLFTAALSAPYESGLHPLTYNVDCMPEQGVDVTSQTEAVQWILVDGDGPKVVEFTSPREESILEPTIHNFTVIISENYGIDQDSVRIFWWVTSTENNNPIHSGNLPITLSGDDNSGLRMEFKGSIDLSVVSAGILQEQTLLKVRFEGRDLAGNQFSKSQNSENNPAHVWNLVKYEPQFSLERSGIDISKVSVEVEEPVVVQIHVRNDGMREGEVPLKVEVIDLSGQSEEIANTRFSVDAQTVSTYIIDWKPAKPGLQRITVTLDGETHHSPYIDVKPAHEKGFLEDTMGSTNPYILGMTMTMICVGLMYVLAWMRFATVKNNEFEEEYELDIEDDSEEY